MERQEFEAEGYCWESLETLATWNTKRLLKYMQNVTAVLHKMDSAVSFESARMEVAGVDESEVHIVTDVMREVMQPAYDKLKTYKSKIKAILKTREHVPNKHEAKIIRRLKAQGRYYKD